MNANYMYIECELDWVLHREWVTYGNERMWLKRKWGSRQETQFVAVTRDMISGAGKIESRRVFPGSDQPTQGGPHPGFGWWAYNLSSKWKHVNPME